MGNQLMISQGSQQDFYLNDLPGISLQTLLSNSRFLKTAKCLHDEGVVVVKVYLKRDTVLSLKRYEQKLQEIREHFINLRPLNVMPFQQFVETEKAGYMIRQYFSSNLRDRLSTRPFLTPIEKRWIVFQLLCALSKCHERKVCHGDVKCENVLLTSWNWVYLADFASFKPCYLPENHPADFSYYFDTGGTRRCYLAPERFLPANTAPPADQLQPSMDIFSAGCVIAQLFLDGEILFDLGLLLKYRRGDIADPPALDRIDDDVIKCMVQNMIHRNPQKRFTAAQFLDPNSRIFPKYFSYFHGLISDLGVRDPDSKVATLHASFPTLLANLHPELEHSDTDFPQSSLVRRVASAPQSLSPSSLLSSGVPMAPDILSSTAVMNLSRDIQAWLEKFYPERASASRAAKGPSTTPKSSVGISHSLAELPRAADSDAGEGAVTRPKCGSVEPPGSCGMVIVASVLCSALRNLRLPSSKLAILDLIVKVADHVDDHVRLQRLLSYVHSLLSDSYSRVKASALLTVTYLVSNIQHLPVTDTNLFTEYIFPALSSLRSDESELVRITYATCLTTLAEKALCFLELAQQIRLKAGKGSETPTEAVPGFDSGSDPSPFLQGSYDADLHDLQETVAQLVTSLLTEETEPPTSTSVKICLLNDIYRLCTMLGRQKTNDLLIPLLITLLNDRDPQLRAAFFTVIPDIGLFVGPLSLQNFLLPCILQGFNDDEEMVTAEAVHAALRLVELQLFEDHKLIQICSSLLPLLCHPNPWIRHNACSFFEACGKQLGPVDVQCMIIPMLRKCLKENKLVVMLDATLPALLHPPVPRGTFSWALRRAEKASRLSDPLPVTSPDQLHPSHHPSASPSPAQVDRPSSEPHPAAEQPSRMSDDRQSSRTPSLTQVSPVMGRSPPIAIRAPSRTTQRSGYEIYNHEPSRRRSIDPRHASAELPEVDLPDWLQPGTDDDSLPPPAFSSDLPQNAQNISERAAVAVLVPHLLGAASRRRQLGVNGSVTPSMAQAKAATKNMRDLLETIPIYSVPARRGIYRSTDDSRHGGTSRHGDGFRPTSSIEVYSYPSQPSASQSSSSSQPVHLRRLDLASIPPAIEQAVFSLSSSSASSQSSPGRKGVLSVRGPGPGPVSTGWVSSSGTVEANRDWRPKGALVIHLQEHRAAINKVVVSRDEAFFATGSADATVKIWDCRHLEKDVVFTSRLTYEAKGKVVGLAMCREPHRIACATHDGHLALLDVSYHTRSPSHPERYLGVKEDCQVDRGDTPTKVTLLESLETPTMSLLLVGDTLGMLTAYDLRSKETAWAIPIHPRYGYPQAVAVDPQHNWLLCGTQRGFLILQDLRFQVACRIWRHPSHSPVTRLVLSSGFLGSQGHQRPPQVSIAAGLNEISVWSLEPEDFYCSMVFRGDTGRDTKASAYWNPPEDHTGNVSQPQHLLAPNEHGFSEVVRGRKEPSVRALLQSPDGWSALISGGSDSIIRCWDVSNPHDSYLVSGPGVHERSLKRSYHVRKEGSTSIIQEELLPGDPPSTSEPLCSPPSPAHIDAITDLALLQSPSRMLLSVSRDGTIKAWK